MRSIHPTAVVDERARLGTGVVIGPYCVVEGAVEIGDHCVLHAHATVMGRTVMGDHNHVFPGAVLGAAPQDLKHDGEPTSLVIGHRNRFREHVTVHPGTRAGGGMTVIGSDGLFMVGSHVAHDCRIGDHVILANHVLLAGHVRVGDRAVLNGASACHHFTTVGRLAYVGGLTRITQDVHPFTIVEGHPARVRGANRVGMRRAGLPAASIERVRRAVWTIFLSRREGSAAAMARLDRQGAEGAEDPLVAELLASIRAADEGRQGRAGEAVGRAR